MPYARFADLVQGEPWTVELDACAAAIAAAVGTGDPMEILTELDVLAAECPSPTPEGVARYLFGAGGAGGNEFHGNHAAYYDWRNSCLDQVLAHRRGIPITLSIVMIEVARRVGVELVGVGMPGHFLVGVRGEERYFDPFHNGVELDAAAARHLFERMNEGRSEWSDSHLAPTPNRHVVARVLNNLQLIFARRSDQLRLAIVMQLRSAIPELATTDDKQIDIAVSPLN